MGNYKVKVKELFVGKIYDVHYKGELIIKGKEISSAMRFFYEKDSPRKPAVEKKYYKPGLSFDPFELLVYKSANTVIHLSEVPIQLNIRTYGEKQSDFEFYELVDESELLELEKREAELQAEMESIRLRKRAINFSF